MVGVIINAVSVIVGSFIGMAIQSGISSRFKNMMVTGIGLICLFVGLSASLSRMIGDDAHPILFIISIVTGGFIGEWIDIDSKLMALGNFVGKKMGSGGFSAGFVSASLMFCVGSMAVIGSIESGISGEHKTLIAKSMMDGVTSILLASSYGIGVLFSSVSIFIYQGCIALLAGYLQSFLTDDMIRELSIVGGILIFAIGLDTLNIKKIKVGNFLPAVFVPVVFYGILDLASM